MATSVFGTIHNQEVSDREDLIQLVSKLDAEEVKIVSQYVANLLLAGVKAAEERKHNGPRC